MGGAPRGGWSADGRGLRDAALQDARSLGPPAAPFSPDRQYCTGSRAPFCPFCPRVECGLCFLIYLADARDRPFPDDSRVVPPVSRLLPVPDSLLPLPICCLLLLPRASVCASPGTRTVKGLLVPTRPAAEAPPWPRPPLRSRCLFTWKSDDTLTGARGHPLLLPLGRRGGHWRRWERWPWGLFPGARSPLGQSSAPWEGVGQSWVDRLPLAPNTGQVLKPLGLASLALKSVRCFKGAHSQSFLRPGGTRVS